MARLVTHRWNLDEGANPPAVGDVVLGRSTRHHWRVVDVRAVESRKWVNAFSARMLPLGEWDPATTVARFRYQPPSAAARS